MIDKTIQNKDELAKLLEINKLLTKSLDLDMVLKTLVEAAKDLVKVSDTIILYLYDPKQNALHIAEGVGVNKEMMRKIAFLPGESLTGITFSQKKPLLFARQEDIQKNMANISPENYQYYFKGVYERQVKSAFCVPLIYQDTCLGVLVVDNFENEGYFTERDMSVIEVIADQSAIAIINSRLVQNLKKKNEQLSNSLDIHKKFTKVILDGGGIETILALLGRILNSRTTYTDTYRQDQNSNLFPIIQGSENYGFIHLERPVTTFSSLELIAMEHAATAMALELVKQNALYEKELHFREDVFNQLIEGIPLAQLKQMAVQLNWNPEWQLQCMVIEGKEEPLWKPDAVLDKEKFVKSVEIISQSYCKSSFVFTKTLQTVIIVPSCKKETMEQIAVAIKQKWGQSNRQMLFGVGRETVIAQLVDSYQEALEAIRYGKKRNGDSFISYSKLGAERLWQKVDPTTLHYFVTDKLEPLFAMGKEYFETLSTYIKCNKNSKKTAQTLHIHPNTLYYRLKKVEQELNISFEDETDWLNLLLAYQIHVSSHK